NRYLAAALAAKSKPRPRAAREPAVSVLMRAVHRKPDASRLRLSRHPRRERNDRSKCSVDLGIAECASISICADFRYPSFGPVGVNSALFGAGWVQVWVQPNPIAP